MLGDFSFPPVIGVGFAPLLHPQDVLGPLEMVAVNLLGSPLFLGRGATDPHTGRGAAKTMASADPGVNKEALAAMGATPG